MTTQNVTPSNCIGRYNTKTEHNFKHGLGLIGLSGTRPRLKIHPHYLYHCTLTHINIPILLVFMQDVCQMNLV